MEIKKSYNVDLEHRRPIAFLLGLVLAVALLFAALQYRQQPESYDLPDDIFDDMTQDLSFMKQQPQRDLATAETAASASHAVTEKVKAVEHVAEEPQKITPTTNPLAVGEGTGAVKEANVSEALPQQPNTLDDNQVEVDEDLLPNFPGGWVELMKWLTKNLKYPVQAQQQHIQGQVVVTFIVGTDGRVSGAKIVKSVHPLLDREVLRLMNRMPAWTPGVSHKKKVRTMVEIPVNFAL